MRHELWMVVCLSAAGAVSCGGSSSADDLVTPADGGGSTSAETACTDAATALCKQIGKCAPALLALVYGDEATCIQRAKPSCINGLAAPNTGATPARYEICAADVAASECSALLSRNLPASCQPAGGSIAADGACGDDWQCQSGYCAIPAGQACGKCASRKSAGTMCADDSECVYGLSCAGVPKVCVAEGMAGAACDDNHPCVSPNVCIGKTITSAGTCGPGAAAGASCATSGCDLAQGLFCNLTNVCQKIGFAQPGEPCGLVNNGLTLCTASACTPPGQLAGICAAVADDGAACDDTNGPKCKPGARCVGGTCQIPDPASCK